MPTSARPGITIDDAFFPHIIDEIWSYFDLETLRGVKAVSKGWRARAAELLDSGHISVCAQGDGSWEVCGRSVYRPSASVLVHVKAGDEAMWDPPASPCWHLSDTSDDGSEESPIASWPWFDVLDVTPPRILTEADFYWLTRLAEGTTLVRWHGVPASMEHPLTGHTAVFFLDLHKDRVPRITMSNSPLDDFDDWTPREIVVDINCYADPTTITRDPGLGGVLEMSRQRWMRIRLEQITVILHDRRPAGTSSAAPPGSGIELLYAYADLIRAPARNGKPDVQFVGLEQFLSAEELREFRRKLKAKFKDTDEDQAREDTMLPRWRNWEWVPSRFWTFPTFQEYRDSMAEEDFKLYTVR